MPRIENFAKNFEPGLAVPLFFAFLILLSLIFLFADFLGLPAPGTVGAWAACVWPMSLGLAMAAVILAAFFPRR